MMILTNIEKKRRANNMTQEQLASQIGVTNGAVSQWEKGRSKPGTGPLLKMSKVFRCEPEELLEVENLNPDSENSESDS